MEAVITAVAPGVLTAIVAMAAVRTAARGPRFDKYPYLGIDVIRDTATAQARRVALRDEAGEEQLVCSAEYVAHGPDMFSSHIKRYRTTQ